jgi:hypothetical protein
MCQNKKMYVRHIYEIVCLVEFACTWNIFVEAGKAVH